MDECDDSQRWQGQGPDSIEQRRRILRSLGAGGAIAGAPTLALATSTRPYCRKDGKNYNPTASAVGSMMGSVVGTAPPKYGHPCSHFKTMSNWGTGWKSGKGHDLTWYNCGDKSTTSGHRLRFWAVFQLSDPGSGDPKARSCAYIIQDYTGSEEGVWLGALLSANKCGARFPYLPGGVIDLYHNRNPLTGGSLVPGLRDKAFVLFRDYLSLGIV